MGCVAPILLRFFDVGRPRAWSVCRPCALARFRPPVAAPAGAGSGGRRGAQRAGSASTPPGAMAPSGGGGKSPLTWGGGGPAPPWPAGQRGKWGVEGRGGRAVVLHPPALGVGPWPLAQSPFFSGAPPLGIYVQPGLPAAPGAGRGLVGRRRVSLAGGGGGGAASAPYPRGLARGAPRGGGRGGLFAAVCSPAFPGRAPRRVASSAPRPQCCIPGCRRSAAAHGVPLSARAGGTAGMSGRLIGGTWHVARLAAAVASPLWVPRPSRGGCGAAASLAGLWLSAGRGGGGRGGGRGGGEKGFPQSHPCPLASPAGSQGGAAWWFRSWGASRRRGGRTLPPPPSTLWVPDPCAGPPSGPLLSSLSPRGAGWPGGGGEGRRVLGAAVRVSG